MTEQTLKSLLQTALDDLAASGIRIDYRNIENAVKQEEATQQRGLSLNRTTISQILKGTYKKVPTDGTIRAIAWLAHVPDAVAFEAAGRRPPGPPFADELPKGIDNLEPKERGVALDLLRLLIEQRQEINRYADLLADTAAQQDAQVKGGPAKKTARSNGPKRPPLGWPADTSSASEAGAQDAD